MERRQIAGSALVLVGGTGGIGLLATGYVNQSTWMMSAGGAGIAVCAIGLIVLWATAPQKAKRPSTPLSIGPPASPLRIEIGETGDFFKTAGSVYGVRRTYLVKISNAAGDVSCRGCQVSVIAATPSTNYPMPWMIGAPFDLAAGAHKNLPLVTYGEARERRDHTHGDSFIVVEPAAGSKPTLEIDQLTVLRLRVTAFDVPYAELDCQVWVSSEGQLRISPAGASTEEPPPPPAHDQWIGLSDLIRYLVEESTWGAGLDDEDADYITKALVELKDHLGGTLAARGRRARNAGGHYAQGLENIPANFWPTADFDVYKALCVPDFNATAKTPDGREWLDIRVKRGHATAIWPHSGREPTNGYIKASREYRLADDASASSGE